MSSDSKKYYHNKGQEDAKKGRYEPAHGILDDLTTWSESGMKKNSEDNTAYKKGYANTKGQEDSAENKYKNPFKESSEEGKAYEESWRDSYDEKKSKSGGCFITTAVVEAKGLNDDCEELECMRSFRDNYLANQPNGKRLISEYYKIAPQIVRTIDKSSIPEEKYKELYYVLVLPILDLIKSHNYREVIERYKSVVNELKNTYLCDNNIA